MTAFLTIAVPVGAASLIGPPPVPATQARLLFLVGYATSGRHWRGDDVIVDEAPQLIPVFAEALWRQAERALRQGPLQGYRTVDESSAVLRGRLREVD